MWVYQEKQQPEVLPLSTGTIPVDAIAESANSEPKPNGNADAPETSPARSLPAAQVSVQSEVHPPQKPAFPSRDCTLLAAAYLFGTFLAGLAAARCSTGESEVFGYYLSCWQKLFSVGTASEAAGLFRTELLTVAGALAVLLFLGLSALGPLPIFLFTIAMGIRARTFQNAASDGSLRHSIRPCRRGRLYLWSISTFSQRAAVCRYLWPQRTSPRSRRALRTVCAHIVPASASLRGRCGGTLSCGAGEIVIMPHPIRKQILTAVCFYDKLSTVARIFACYCGSVGRAAHS